MMEKGIRQKDKDFLHIWKNFVEGKRSKLFEGQSEHLLT